ncbi:MAG: hypothetical protein JXA73_25390 [Acidobacteria bacterium]|nr:hypothetical protein [Acidobacteriota bacterium]
MKRIFRIFSFVFTGLTLLGSSGSGVAGYKARNWTVNPRESYPASLTSEGVTIAVEPFFTDAMAARVFDKKDIVTRGIMPLAIVIFNDNDYAIEVDGLSIELIRDDDRIRTLTPAETVNRLFSKNKNRINPSSPKGSNPDALMDFGDKFLMDKVIAPHDKGGGFLYMKIYNPEGLAGYLSKAAVYIPNVYRQDDGSRLIYFEIDLKAAVSTGIPK